LPKGNYKVTSQRTLTTGNSKTHFVEIEQIWATLKIKKYLILQ
jgi:hypothetical protein